MTYEQLQRISGIYRNSLRKRLDQLTNDGLIIKYKFRLRKDDFFYGNTKEHPLYGYLPDSRFYYLLNLWNEDTRILLRHHYSLDEIASPDKREEMIQQLMTKVVETSSSIDRYILSCNFERELDLLHVATCHRRPKTISKDVSEGIVENLVQFADHIIRFGCSILDLIIRCCSASVITTENITNIPGVIPKFLLLPMFHYRHLLYLLINSTKYKQQVFGIFKN